MKQFFQGAWLGHPLHPLLIEVPVALWPAAFVFDLLARLGIGGNALVRAAFVAVLLGILAAVPAAVAGIFDWSGVKQRNPAWRVGLIHMALNLSATVLAIISFILRIPHLDADEVRSLPVLLMAGVAVLVGISSYLGGRMVYEYGISVARLTKSYWAEVARAGRPEKPTEEGGP